MTEEEAKAEYEALGFKQKLKAFSRWVDKTHGGIRNIGPNSVDRWGSLTYREKMEYNE